MPEHRKVHEEVDGGDNELEQKIFLSDILDHADSLARHARNEIVAHYINEHKKSRRWTRPQDEKDDYYKAEYLNYLAEYLRKPVGNYDPTFPKLIDMVFYIFDRAYFNKARQPHRSDLCCFTEAERYYCLEKLLEYMAYFEYEGRQKQGRPGDAYSDYMRAKEKYDAKQKIQSNNILPFPVDSSPREQI